MEKSGWCLPTVYELYHLQNLPVQWWHKAYGHNQPTSDLTVGPVHEMKPIPNTAWVANNLRLSIAET